MQNSGWIVLFFIFAFWTGMNFSMILSVIWSLKIIRGFSSFKGEVLFYSANASEEFYSNLAEIILRQKGVRLKGPWSRFLRKSSGILSQVRLSCKQFQWIFEAWCHDDLNRIWSWSSSSRRFFKNQIQKLNVKLTHCIRRFHSSLLFAHPAKAINK